ncbi:LysR substrate-binding domain-containing protein [Escherichia coli]|uniref:LysR substrate-binding domain-containing protein n=1 Tax=Escherichia coli TaxID=562 RepID=UPI002151D0D8|nr:LysR substrate-binding domain-containing protein [Escherichia coli]MCR6129692.1 LysR substrate-binding domain-containing protein [Escherichia coli]
MSQNTLKVHDLNEDAEFDENGVEVFDEKALVEEEPSDNDLAEEELLSQGATQRVLDATQLYLGEIGYSPLLTAEEEGELNGQSLLGVPNIKIAAAHSLSLSVLPKLVHSLTAYGGEFVYHVEAIDVVQAVNTLREGKSDFIISFRDEDLMQSPFCCLKLFESELYPVCAADAQGHPVFDITQPQVPLLNYTATSYMGRLVNRHLAEVGGITGRTIFISSMSELLKNMALNGYGIAWLPIWSIVDELQTKRLICLDAAKLTVPIQAYIYRMNTRLNRTAENLWRILQEHMPDDLIQQISMEEPARRN